MDKKGYKSPRLVCYGPIADHTFPTPSGVSDKSGDTTFATDKYGEFSHPAAS